MSGAAESATRIYASLVGLGLACGLLVAGAFQATASVIAQNRAEARARAIFEVVPGAARSAAFAEGADGSFAPVGDASPGGATLHAAYAPDGRLVGVALEASAPGYQDVVTVLYGYAFAEQAIVGMVVLGSRETPGLGDRIESDPDFRRSFERLDASLDEGGAALRHPIEVVKPGQRTAPHQIDTITGATISSTAVARMVGESAARWIPRVVARRADLEGGGS